MMDLVHILVSIDFLAAWSFETSKTARDQKRTKISPVFFVGKLDRPHAIYRILSTVNLPDPTIAGVDEMVRGALVNGAILFPICLLALARDLLISSSIPRRGRQSISRHRDRFLTTLDLLQGALYIL